MRVCFVAEGCYPYVVGGVSSWIHSMIKAFSNVEFIILAIVPNREFGGKFAYELPENVTEVHEVYLEDIDWFKNGIFHRRYRLNRMEYRALRSIILNENVRWEVLFDMFRKKRVSINDMLMGPEFLTIATEYYDKSFPQINFADFLWTMRSIYLPLFFVLNSEIPKADMYHCSATGYSGILGCMAKYFYGSSLLISEHGIYTREREEELIKATWVRGIYKNIWIEQFKKMSLVAYDMADLVTSLYAHASELQQELGCPPEKTRITPNGIDASRLADIPGKKPEDEGFINIGAVLRVTPIKDVKTMIQAFSFAHETMPNLKLWIMGPTDEDEEYAKECFDLVDMLKNENIIFTGRIDIRDYLGRMDMTILTSISEGQPLTILESFAAHKPVIATDVGNCSELIYGYDDNYGEAGILTHIMNIEEISYAILKLARDEDMRIRMGNNGYNRMINGFRIEDMRNTYREIYRWFAENKEGCEWKEE